MIKGLDLLVQKYGDIMVNEIKQRLYSDGNVASGDTIRSVKDNSTRTSINIEYDETLQAISDGLNPRIPRGGGAGRDEFVENIMDWMRSKNITPQVQAGNMDRRMRSSAWLITRAIRSRGTIKREGYKGTDVLELISPESKIMNDLSEEIAQVVADSLEF